MTTIQSQPNIIVITLSGVRNSETIRDATHQYIPHLWHDIIPAATLYTNLINENVNFHITAVQAINSGKNYPVWSHVTSELDVPTLFQYVGEKYKIPRTKMWSIGHWEGRDVDKDANKIFSSKKYPLGIPVLTQRHNLGRLPYKILSKPELQFFTNFFRKKNKNLGPFWSIWDSIGEAYYHLLKSVFTKLKPKLVHYVMPDIEVGHFGTFGRYVLALKAIDRRIYELWQMINRDPYYKDTTYLIVNVDHGRDSYYMEHDQVEENVWMLIYGPGIKKRNVVDRVIHHTDIFTTVAHLMDVETDVPGGRILEECFEGAAEEGIKEPQLASEPVSRYGASADPESGRGRGQRKEYAAD